MIRAARSQWLKLTRLGMVLGGAGTLIAFTILSVVLSLVTATDVPPLDADGPGGMTFGQLNAADGFAQALQGAAGFLGVVALVIVAINVASEYSQGTIRAVLVRQPRRLVVLAGTGLALAVFLTAAMVIAVAAAFVTALAVGPGQGVDTAAWLTGDGAAALASASANLVLATLGWGLLGAVLALAFRSPAPAIGTGLAYALPFELLLSAAWRDGANWLPGQLLGALAAGGTQVSSYGRTSLLLSLYSAVALIGAAVVFRRRDVSS